VDGYPMVRDSGSSSCAGDFVAGMSHIHDMLNMTQSRML